MPDSQSDTDGTAESLPPTAKCKAIQTLRAEIAGGKHWYYALLETVARWDKAEETLDGQTLHYLIAREAFDWQLLVQRLCGEIKGIVPEDEVENLLFHSTPPINVTREKFKEFIGTVKYRQYLNYFYGVTVEDALVMEVQDEVRKERHAWGYQDAQDGINEAYRRIYGTTRTVLLRKFRQERGYPSLNSIDVSELKEFIYWCFKYRVKQSEQARMASDTKKGLDWLRRNGYPRTGRA